MGSRGTARKFRDAARSSGTLAASPQGFVASTFTCSMPWEPEPPPGPPEWRVEGQTQVEGRKGARGSAGHLRVLLGEAVGRGAGGGEQR